MLRSETISREIGVSEPLNKLPLPRRSVRAAIVNPAVSILITLALLSVCTWGLMELRTVTNYDRPYTILYLIPVTVGAALLGVRWGLISTALALALARVYLFNDQKQGLSLLLSLPDVAEDIEFCAMGVGMITTSIVTGWLRSTLSLLKSSNENLKQSNLSLAHANERLIDSEEQRRLFNRDVLLAVTHGKLRLVEEDELLTADFVSKPPVLTTELTEPMDATKLRHSVNALAKTVGLVTDRISDLSTGVTEAATNAIKHGNGGEARVWTSDEAITVLIADHGTGIAPANLARATLEQGFSTRVSLGMGFHLMMETVDSLAMCTGAHGTSLLLHISNKERVSESEALLSRYINL